MQNSCYMYKYILFCLGLVISFLGGRVSAQTSSEVQSNRQKLTILYVTDLYGRLRDFRCRRQGVEGYTYEPTKRDIANLLFQVRRIEREIIPRQQHQLLLFNTGDNLGTDLTSRFLLEFQGISGVDFIVEVFQRFAFSLVGIGNHEFSVLPEKLSEFLKQASLRDVRFAVANLVDKHQQCLKENQSIEEANKEIKEPQKKNPLKTCKAPKVNHSLLEYIGTQKRYHVYQVGSIKVGVFHVVPNELHKSVSASTVNGIEFSEPASAAGEIAQKLRTEEKVDLVVMLSHLEDIGTRGGKVREILNQNTSDDQRIDLVITNELRERDPMNPDLPGNPSAISTFDQKGNGIYIVGGAMYGEQLGRVDLEIEKTAEKTRIVSFQMSSVPLEDDKFDIELRRELIKWELSYCKRWGQPLGDGRIRTQEGMNREQFVTYLLNLMRFMTGAEVAIINDGAVRPQPFPIKGYVTRDDLYRALPFNGTFEMMRIKGSKLEELIKFNSESAGRKRLFFAGVDVSGHINGRPLQSEFDYTIVTISFVAANRGAWLDTPIPNHQRYLFRYSDGSIPRTRDTMQVHFQLNAFRKLPPTPPPKEETSSYSQINSHVAINNIPLPAPALSLPNGKHRSTPTTALSLSHPSPPSSSRLPSLQAGNGRSIAPALSFVSLDHENVLSPFQGYHHGQASTALLSGSRLAGTGSDVSQTKPKKTAPKPFGPNEIPYTGNFINLRDRVAWRFNSKIQGGLSSIFINPVNIGTMYSLQQDFSGDFYQKHQIGASMELKLQMDTRIHLWITTMSIEYDANFSYQWSDMEPKGPVFPAIFQESNDRVLFKTEYRLRYFQALFDQRKWYYTDPFVEFSIETELTRGSRPDLSDDALFLSGVNERFRHLAFNLKVGFSFQIIDQLNLKIGFNLQKTHPSEVVVNYIPHMIEQPPTSVLPGQPGQVIRDDYSKLSINTNLTLGGSIEYELEKIKLFSIANTPFSWGSQAEYRFNIQTGNKDRLNFIHYLRWTNSFGFDIMGQFSLAFGFRLYLLQDIFRPFPNAPTFVQGPWGVRIEPFIRLNFEWATRGQLS